MKEIGEELLRHVGDLAVNDDAMEWLAGIREIIGIEHPTPTQRQGLAAYIGLAAADIRAHARDSGIDAARTASATAALNAANSI
ncbi:MAG: hypothetical protein H5T76_22765 [Streptomyces sp.]|nr:hypothetical protein [Streptomyces sp.]